jgi:cell division protein ZapC
VNQDNFRPTAQWQWLFDTETQQLCADIGAQKIEIVYNPRMLVLECDFPLYFTLEDVMKYNILFDSLPLAEYSEAESCSIILHMLAAGLFHKPIMPKDWLFQPPETDLIIVQPETIVSLCGKGQATPANYILIEELDGFSLCLLIDDEHHLSDRKTFKKYHLIKVSNKLLSQRYKEGDQHWDSYQIG